MLFSRGSCQPRNQTQVSCIANRFFTIWATREAQNESISCSVMSSSLQPHGLQPASLLCPWNSPGKNIEVGCHSLFQVVKNPPANAGDLRDEGSTPGLGRSPGESMATHSSILTWKIPWTEETDGLWSTVSQSLKRLSMHNAELWKDHGLWNQTRVHVCVHAKSFQSCPTLCNHMDHSLPGSSVHGMLQARILECHALLQGIFLTQGSNLGLPHCRH